MTFDFYCTYFLFSSFVYVDRYAPQHQGKFLICENLLGNKPDLNFFLAGQLKVWPPNAVISLPELNTNSLTKFSSSTEQ